MMDINAHNYEAFFLDYWEGQLSDAEREAVEVFVANHPELAPGFNAFKSLNLSADDSLLAVDWSALKKEEHAAEWSEQERAEFFLRAADDQLTEKDQAILLSDTGLAESIRGLDQLKLVPGQEALRDTDLYHLDFSGEIDDTNYDEFFDARDSGLLSPAEEHKLIAFEAAHPQKVAGMHALRLRSDDESIFAHKPALHRREARVIPLFVSRALAAAAVMAGFIVLWQFWPSGNTIPALADQTKTVDSTSVNAAAPNDTANVKRDGLEEAAIAENGFAEIEKKDDPAGDYENQPKSANQVAERVKVPLAPVLLPERNSEISRDIGLAELAAQSQTNPDSLASAIENSLKEQLNGDELATADKATEPAENYLTLAELAKQKLNDGLKIPEEKRGNPLKYLAKKFASDAGRVVGAEVKTAKASPNEEFDGFAFKWGDLEITSTKNRSAE